MSNEPTPPTPPPPQQQQPQSKAGKGCAGCLGVIVLLALTGWIGDMAGCHSDSEQETAQKQLLKEMGPDNAIAKRIYSLTRDNAYSVGMTVGANDAMKMSVAGNWDRYDYHSKLRDLRELQSSFLDLLATQNKFNSVVFEQYKRGWDYGASTLSIR